jgi:hypothetical protein
MLKTSVDLRLRAILLLHEDHAHFHARGTNPKDIADLQDGGTVDAMAIKKRSVTTLIRNHALAICRHDFTMSAGDTRHVLLEIKPPLTLGRVRSQYKHRRVDRSRVIAYQHMRWARCAVVLICVDMNRRLVPGQMPNKCYGTTRAVFSASCYEPACSSTWLEDKYLTANPRLECVSEARHSRRTIRELNRWRFARPYQCPQVADYVLVDRLSS